MRILIVDNDTTLEHLLRSILGDDSVDFVAYPRQALEVLDGDYDVIVVDGVMPGLSGPEFVRLAQQWFVEHGKPVPRLVAMTAHQCMAREFESLGVSIVGKPFTLREFIRPIKGEAWDP